MLLQILDLLVVLLRQAVARRVGDVHHRGTRLDHGLHHLRQILVVGTSGILAVKLHVIYKPFGVLRSRHGALQNLLAGRVKLIQYMLVARADTRMYALVLGILQGLEGHVDIALHGSGQCTNHRPRHGFRNLNHTVKVARTRNGESSLDHIHAQLLQGLSHLNLLYGVQLAPWYLFSVSQRRVENK